MQNYLWLKYVRNYRNRSWDLRRITFSGFRGSCCFRLVPRPIDLLGSCDAHRFAKVLSHRLYCENKMSKHMRSTCNVQCIYFCTAHITHCFINGGLQCALRSDVSRYRYLWPPLSAQFWSHPHTKPPRGAKDNVPWKVVNWKVFGLDYGFKWLSLSMNTFLKV